MTEAATLLGVPLAIEGLDLQVVEELGPPPPAGLLAVAWRGADRMVCSFRLDTEGVSLELPTGEHIMTSSAFGTERLRAALMGELADDAPPLELPGTLLGQLRDLAMRGATPEAIENQQLSQWWHLFGGAALELRLLIAPPFDPMPPGRRIELLLIGPSGSRAAVTPASGGRVIIGSGRGVVDQFVDSVESIRLALV
jgi:hypothetical protein